MSPRTLSASTLILSPLKTAGFFIGGIAVAIVITGCSPGEPTKSEPEADKFPLPHYQLAQKITQGELDVVVPETKIVEGEKLKAIPGLIEYLGRTGFIDDDPIDSIFFTNARLIEDEPANMFYLQDTLDFKLDRFIINAFPQDFSEEPSNMKSSTEASESGLPYYDERWKSTGGLACFSCGCSCYMGKQFQVANGEFYVNVTGEDFAIRPERQGIYFYDKNRSSWVKLTPKIDGDFKLANHGCNVYYTINSQPFSLNACSVSKR